MNKSTYQFEVFVIKTDFEKYQKVTSLNLKTTFKGKLINWNLNSKFISS